MDDELVDKPIIEYSLTTIDNPYHPRDEYELWKTWDEEHYYNTEEYLSRIVDTISGANVENEREMNQATEQAINEILEHDDLGIYRLV